MVSKDTYNVFIAVYMMANRRHGTIYIGVTGKLPSRVYEHCEGLVDGFTKTYGLKRLVWYEPNESMTAAIQREKSLKKYTREWKINLIERENPYWEDLYPALVGKTKDSSKLTVMAGLVPTTHELRAAGCAWMAATRAAMTVLKFEIWGRELKTYSAASFSRRQSSTR